MLVNPYVATDQSGVIDLWKRCELTRPWNDPRKDIQRKLSEQPELFLVGKIGGAIVATVMGGFDRHRGWVSYLAVAPEHRKQGLGRVLMQHVEGALQARGCPKINIQVRSTNAAALAFYRRIGYGTDDVVSLGKRLIPDTP
jgi:ribosomal protein S18 acetylase RimI-like enzyme